MKDAIILWYEKNNITLPQNNADIINATYHSLAYSYKKAISSTIIRESLIFLGS